MKTTGRKNAYMLNNGMTRERMGYMLQDAFHHVLAACPGGQFAGFEAMASSRFRSRSENVREAYRLARAVLGNDITLRNPTVVQAQVLAGDILILGRNYGFNVYTGEAEYRSC
jgi:hypothetical protein